MLVRDGGRGPPTLPGSASQTAGSRWRSAWGGEGSLTAHSLWRPPPSCHTADVRAEECGKQSTHWGALFSGNE